MRRRVAAAGVAAALGLTLGADAVVPAAGPQAAVAAKKKRRPVPLTSVGIGLLEWELGLYRPTVPKGKVKFNITNLGEDGHDFAVRKRGRVLLDTRELRPGERLTKRVRFRRRGRYELVCTLPGHEQLGMKARLRVKRR